MSNRSSGFRSASDICAHLKHLGYAISKRIRLYGEEFEVVSDPFPEDSGDGASGCKRAETTLTPNRVESAIVEQEKASMDKSKDQDRGKGAMEKDQQNQGGNTSNWGIVMRMKS